MDNRFVAIAREAAGLPPVKQEDADKLGLACTILDEHLKRNPMSRRTYPGEMAEEYLYRLRELGFITGGRVRSVSSDGTINLEISVTVPVNYISVSFTFEDK